MAKLTIKQGYNEVVFEFPDVCEAADFMNILSQQATKKTTFELGITTGGKKE
jgi:hypothetical protein